MIMFVILVTYKDDPDPIVVGIYKNLPEAQYFAKKMMEEDLNIYSTITRVINPR